MSFRHSPQQNYLSSEVVNHYKRFKGLKKCERYLVNKYCLPESKILDLGCGTGRTSIYLFEKSPHTIGLDYSRPMLDEAKRACPNGHFVEGTALSLPFKDDAFDVVLFSYNGLDTIVPLQSRCLALKEMVRVVRPAGLIIYSSRNLYFRIFNRFRQKPLLTALKSNLSELLFNLRKSPLDLVRGYILQSTHLEGLMQVYTSTVSRNIAQFRKHANEFVLLELVGNTCKNFSRRFDTRNHMIYYVWKREGKSSSMTGPQGQEPSQPRF